MDRILSLLNDEALVTDVKIEKKEKRRKKRVKSVEVAPLFKDSGDYADPPHKHLMRLPFSLLEIAPKGSGKTTLLQNMLVWYYPYFDQVFIWSPTINLDYKWGQIIDKLEIPPEQLFNKYTENEVSGLMRKIKDFNNGRESKEKIRCLFIFDDIVEQLPKSKKVSALNKLAMNHRHYNISHIIISQSYKKLDPVVRSNTTGMILFNTDNTAERMKIIEELAGNLGRREFERLWYECIKEKFSFMYINYDTRLVYKKFDEEIADLSQMPVMVYDKLNEGERKKYIPKGVEDPKKKKKEPKPSMEPTKREKEIKKFGV